MSGESELHLRLVETLIRRIESRHTPPRGLMLFADHHRFGNDRPPNIGGFTPDVFASDLPVSFRLIGEAKTAADLETGRSQRQILAFLDHLALYDCSTFYLAVPWVTQARARFIMRSLLRPAHSKVLIEVTSLELC